MKYPHSTDKMQVNAISVSDSVQLAELLSNQFPEAGKLREVLAPRSDDAFKLWLLMESAGIEQDTMCKVIEFIFYEIPATPFLRPQYIPKTEWKMLYKSELETLGIRFDNERDPAWDAAYGKIRGVIPDSAWHKVYDAAFDVALESAGKGENAYRIARDAAEASICMLFESTVDLEDGGYLHDLVFGIWEVWHTGHRLFGRFNEDIYVDLGNFLRRLRS